MIVAKEMPDICPKCKSQHFKQDEDVLDTWFSSALWPFSTLGWPEDTESFKYFYPTNVLVTGHDIIFFWVIRMVFAGIDMTGKLPFKDVFLHGIVRDDQGRKMSKSLGNGIDPLDLIDQYGSDALRFMLSTGNTPGNDIKFQTDRVEASRNFANKLWNASRFVIMGLENEEIGELDETDKLTLADQWILSRRSQMVKEITHSLDKYELGMGAQKIYEFTWNNYCDWYIELAKKRLYGEDENEKRTVKRVLLTVLKDILRLLHPFMPFITEEIWGHIPNTGTLLVNNHWPENKENWINEEAETQMALIMEAIKNLRNVRAEMDVVPSRKATCLVLASDKSIENLMMAQAEYLIALASCSEVKVISDKNETPEDAVSAVIPGAELFLPLADLIDFEKELERLKKEKAKLETEVERVVKKLSNEGFVKKAPAEVIEEENAKKEKYLALLETVVNRIEAISKKI